MSQQHTPTPLPANSNPFLGQLAIDPKDRQNVISKVDGVVVAQCETFYRPVEDSAAFAAFIVKAVNAHEELVAALKDALNQLETNYADARLGGHHWSNERVNMTSAAKLKARAILAKVQS